MLSIASVATADELFYWVANIKIILQLNGKNPDLFFLIFLSFPITSQNAEWLAEQEIITPQNAEYSAEQENITLHNAEYSAEREIITLQNAECSAEQEIITLQSVEWLAEAGNKISTLIYYNFRVFKSCFKYYCADI